jgi:hypothetical protein
MVKQVNRTNPPLKSTRDICEIALGAKTVWAGAGYSLRKITPPETFGGRKKL